MKDQLSSSDILIHNRESNFLEYETLNDEFIASFLGQNFLQIMKGIREMKDTFGLCGVVSTLASAIGCRRDKYGDIIFDPALPKSLFDSWWENRTGIESWEWFMNNYGIRFASPSRKVALVAASSIDLVNSTLTNRNKSTFNSNQWNEAINHRDDSPITILNAATLDEVF